MQSTSSIAMLIFLGILALTIWFRLDMRSILRSMQSSNQLSIEGRWDELEAWFERASKTIRPFVWLHRKYLLPGNLEARQALFLRNQGRLEEALAKVDQAIQQMEQKPRIFHAIYRSETFNTVCAAHRARALILTGLGRYEEARATCARIQGLIGSSSHSNDSLALLEYFCGHLDEALEQAKGAHPDDKQYDAMRGIAALAYAMKGEFNQAIQALAYEPADISKFYAPGKLELLNRTSEGPELIELQRRRLAAVTQPARLILLAAVFINSEQFDDAALVLDRAEKLLGPEPGGQMSYLRHRACCLAAQGKRDESEKYLARMRTFVKQLPARSFRWEMHLAAGRSYLYFGAFREALAELIEAERFGLHPIEKHTTAYLLAQAHERAGNREEVLSHYRQVAEDSIPSWMRRRAVEALTRQLG